MSYRQTQYQFSYPHSKSFYISISDFYSDQLNSWHTTKHGFEPFIWPIVKIFCLWEILKKNSTKYLHLGSCFESFSSKNERLFHHSDLCANVKIFNILNCYHIHFILTREKFSILKTSPFGNIPCFAENMLEWIHALVAVLGTNIKMSLDGSKQGPKWRYLMRKKFNISKAKMFSDKSNK